MIPLNILLFVLLPSLLNLQTVHPLTPSAEITRSRLAQALSSPSGKLTLSPEIVIPEPSNPTAILLQATSVTSLSNKIRTKAKANAAWISATSMTTLKNFCIEQEDAQGSFPGPVPVIYCDPRGVASSDEATLGIEKGDATGSIDLEDVAAAGASGVLVPVCAGSEIASLQDMGDSESAWVVRCKDVLKHGLQPIPEIEIADTEVSSWKEEDMEAVVQKIADLLGQDPVSVLVTVKRNAASDGNDNEDVPETPDVALPPISKTLGKRVPMLGSVRMAAGENRLGEETARMKAAGFKGAVLRRECVPGYRINLSLEYVSNFWSACIGELKSTRSKSFNFQSKNLMEKLVPLEWAKYQKDILESGALGSAEDNAPIGFNPDGGDYKGF